MLSELRDRLLAGEAAERLLEPARCRAMGLSKPGANSVRMRPMWLAAVRSLHRLELVAETLRAALNELAPSPRRGCAWLSSPGMSGMPNASKTAVCLRSRASETPMPRRWAKTAFLLLDALESPEAPETPAHPAMCRDAPPTLAGSYERQTGTPEGRPPQARSVSRSHGNYHGRRCTSHLPLMLTPATAPKAAPSGRAPWSM